MANKIALGQIESGIGGGSDTTSGVRHGKLRAPPTAPRAPATRSARSPPASFSELKPGVAEPRTGKSMGDHCGGPGMEHLARLAG